METRGRPKSGNEELTLSLYEQGFGIDEIAKKLGCKESTVKVRLKQFGVYDRPLTKTYLKNLNWGKWEFMDLIIGETYRIQVRVDGKLYYKPYKLSYITQNGLYVFEREGYKTESYGRHELAEMMRDGRLRK